MLKLFSMVVTMVVSDYELITVHVKNYGQLGRTEELYQVKKTETVDTTCADHWLNISLILL